MKVEHPKKYDRKLAKAMRTALLAGTALTISSCVKPQEPEVMGIFPAEPEIDPVPPKEVQDDPSTKKLGEIEEYEEILLSPRMISIPTNIVGLLPVLDIEEDIRASLRGELVEEPQQPVSKEDQKEADNAEKK